MTSSPTSPAREHRAGFVNLIGLPNVGKSTLLNALLGERLVIVTPKPQTTRHRILGILDGEDYQVVLSDTPGVLQPTYELQQSMMRAVGEALEDADVLVVVTQADQGPEQNEEVVARVVGHEAPILVLLNKMDLVNDQQLNTTFERWQERLPEATILPISALHGHFVPELRDKLIQLLPAHPPYFPKDELSDRDMRFFVAEIIREKILDQYEQEVPYSAQVVVNQYKDTPDLLSIQADIIMMRQSQKGIVIGSKGKALKRLGTAARKAMEQFIGKKIFLDLKVKVDEHWRTDEKKLRRYGY